MTQPFYSCDAITAYNWKRIKTAEVWQADDLGPRGRLMASFHGRWRRLKARLWIELYWFSLGIDNPAKGH